MTEFRCSDISFLQKGSGKDLVFLHGFGSNKESFSSQISYFSQFYRVTAFDFLSHGQSKGLYAPFSLQDYADTTLLFLSELGVQSPYLIAHSFGVRVAIKMVARYGQVFDKLIFTGPAGVMEKRGFSYHFKVKTYKIVKKLAPRFAERKFGSEEYKRLSPIEKESYKKIVNEDLTGSIHAITAPYLIIQGKEDKTTPLSSAKIFLNEASQGRMQMIEGGHFAFAENPLAFNLIVEEFLQ